MPVKMTTHVLLTTLLLVYSWTGCRGYNSGAPTDACVSMVPGTVPGATGGGEGHTSDTQNKAPLYGNSEVAPYSIVVSGSVGAAREVDGGVWLEVNPGMSYQVNIISDQSDRGTIYKGILLMAREIICYSNDSVQVKDDPIGTFTVDPTGALTTLACGQIERSAISHKSPQYKINEKVTWTAPADQKLNVIFRATIMQSLNVYWTEIYSKPIHILGAPAPMVCSTTSLYHQPISSVYYIFITLTVIQSVAVVHSRS